jgi:hypothetical protein
VKHQEYERHCTLPIDLVLSGIQDAVILLGPAGKNLGNIRSKNKIKKCYNGIEVNVTSLRLQTFLQKGTRCVHCGLNASHFAIERSRGNSWHLNLWGVKESGEEILFTHDHILARGLGGLDRPENTQTMCTECNFQKSLEENKLKQQK